MSPTPKFRHYWQAPGQRISLHSCMVLGRGESLCKQRGSNLSCIYGEGLISGTVRNLDHTLDQNINI